MGSKKGLGFFFFFLCTAEYSDIYLLWRKKKVSHENALKENWEKSVSVSQLCPSTCRFPHFKITRQLLLYGHCHWRQKQGSPCQSSDLIKEMHSDWKWYRICTEREELIQDGICKVKSYGPKFALRPAFPCLTSAGNTPFLSWLLYLAVL